MACGTEYRSPAPGRFCWFGSPAGGIPPHSEGPTPHQQLSTSPGKLRQPSTLAVSAPLFRSWRTALSEMPTVSSANVREKSVDSSGVKSSPSSVERSCSPLTVAVKRVPGLSRGRAVRMLIVEPIPPVGTSAWLVL